MNWIETVECIFTEHSRVIVPFIDIEWVNLIHLIISKLEPENIDILFKSLFIDSFRNNGSSSLDCPSKNDLCFSLVMFLSNSLDFLLL